MLETDLPGAGLADDAERLAQLDLVAQVGDGGDQPVLGGEPDREVLHDEERLVARLSATSRFASAAVVGHESLTLGSRML